MDLDGTLAVYTGWKGIEHIGEPVQLMSDRVKNWSRHGIVVKIVTARFNEGPEAVKIIQEWCQKHFGFTLEVTATKDFGMIELWDDRAIAVEANTGVILGGKYAQT